MTRRTTIVISGRGMPRDQFLKQETIPTTRDLSNKPKPGSQVPIERSRANLKRGGYSIKDWVKPEPGEHHILYGNYEGPGTKVYKRLTNNVPPTSHTDAAARLHDSAYWNVGLKLARGQITKQEAIRKVRAADNKLIAAAKNAPPGIVEKAHALGAITGMKLKKGLEDVGLLQGTKFIHMDPNAPELPAPYNQEGAGKRKKKAPKKNLLEGLRKRMAGIKEIKKISKK